jgi:type II secretory pathway component GspD/PulD (secretin)
VGTRDVAFVPASDAGGRAEGVVPETPIEGVVLSVTPQIGLDGIITMRISPRVTERAEALSSSDGDRRPVLTVREADTVVRVFEGETVVVAGLTQDRLIERSGRAPVLGAIPLLGRMFRRDRTVAMTSDLVVLLTPRIVVPGRLTAAMTKP